MIIFFENGRLGNQIFQYCALKKFHKKGSIFLVGMRSLKTMFTGVEVVGGTNWVWKLIERFIFHLAQGPLHILAKKLRVIGFVEEELTAKGSKLIVQNGFFKNLYYCSQIYFQSENMIENSVAEKIELKPELLNLASIYLMKLPCERTATFFVHVRRGDYLNWPSRSAPAVLPLIWYQEQMNLVRSKYAKPFFVIVSDDGLYADEMFGHCEDVLVSYENEELDFALMSRCDGGILSASSFAWWAAYFARRNNKDAFFIAPLYWVGHCSKIWHPQNIETSWLTYAEVKS